MNVRGVATAEETREAFVPLRGLTSAEASERLREFGPNDAKPRRRGVLFHELLLLFVNPLVVILLIASMLSAVLGQRADAASIFLIAMSPQAESKGAVA